MTGAAGKKRARVDELLVERGLFGDVDAARRAVFAGEVVSDQAHITAPSQIVPVGTDLRRKGAIPYVSRGGLKLEHALGELGFDPSGLRCIDAGAATGGFTDCLLRHGASSVAAVDVAYGELADSLRRDGRVAVFERTNIKEASAASLGGPFDLLVADLSFISLTGLAEVFGGLLREGGHALVMVKPQFEAARDEVESGGVVSDPHVRERVVAGIERALADAGFELLGRCASGLPGKKKGNREVFILARFGVQ